MEIQGKRAVVVGGASGMGRATAQALAKAGAAAKRLAIAIAPSLFATGGTAKFDGQCLRLDAGMRFGST